MKKPFFSVILIVATVGLVWAVRSARGSIPALLVEPAKIKGPLDAAVSITLFSDFQCPYCKQIEPTLATLMEVFPKDLKIIFKQYPLEMHPHSMSMAEASECAADQGKFWEYHDELFSHVMESYEVKDIKPFLFKIASEQKLLLEPFAECIESKRKNVVVKQNMKEGKNILLSGTPTLLLNGSIILRSFRLEDIKKQINEELQKVRKT